jgi:hypothetical protein
VTVGAVWIPLAAELTVANRGDDNEAASLLLAQLPGEVRYVLGDTHYNDPELRQQCHRRGCELIATQRGPYPHRDEGVEVRKGFHQLRSHAIAPFNGWYKNIFDWRVKMPVKGLPRAAARLGGGGRVSAGLVRSTSTAPAAWQGHQVLLEGSMNYDHVSPS